MVAVFSEMTYFDIHIFTFTLLLLVIKEAALECGNMAASFTSVQAIPPHSYLSFKSSYNVMYLAESNAKDNLLHFWPQPQRRPQGPLT